LSFSYSRRARGQRLTRRDRTRQAEQGFTCRHCNMYVSCAPELAGVQNRNHCPHCLWSRHLDGRVAGDRRSACRAAMRPIGLTTKLRRNKYASERDGELMVIHRCTVCAKVAVNRIAADDSAAALLELFAASCGQAAELQAELAGMGILMLTADDGGLVRRRLFGNAAAPDVSGGALPAPELAVR